MTDLSPAAQAVVNAVDHYETNHWLTPREVAAAALRAAIDQAHPKSYLKDIIGYVHQNYIDGWKDALDAILAIADDLEGTHNE
jgi:deoxyribodipyrimidine photolyase-like uncharacterized protein